MPGILMNLRLFEGSREPSARPLQGITGADRGKDRVYLWPAFPTLQLLERGQSDGIQRNGARVSVLGPNLSARRSTAHSQDGCKARLAFPPDRVHLRRAPELCHRGRRQSDGGAGRLIRMIWGLESAGGIRGFRSSVPLEVSRSARQSSAGRSGRASCPLQPDRK
jgi:hypothetical protein